MQNQKSHAKSSQIFEKGILAGQRYRRMEDQKRWPGLALNLFFLYLVKKNIIRRANGKKLENSNWFITNTK